MPDRSHEDRSFVVSLVAAESDAGLRLDRFIAENTDEEITRSRIQKLISDGSVSVNGKAVSKSHKVGSGDRVEVTVTPLPVVDLSPEKVDFAVLFEDEYLAVVNKPAGLVTHPGAGNLSGTLVNGLLYHFKHLSTVGDAERPGVVHRLDKDTSGLLIVARTDAAYLRLQAAIQRREVKRTYLALVCGHVREDSGTIDLPIGRSRRDRKKMVVNGIDARRAITDYHLLERFRSYDLLEVNLQTGRTHQIRVHLSHLGHPVFGDPEYGGREKWHKGIFAPERPLANKMLAQIGRQALHAIKLEFDHPISGQQLTFEAPIPWDIEAVLEMLRVEGV